MKFYTCLDKKSGSKKELRALKLDMSKAYDRIELRVMIERMSFAKAWVDIVMKCVSTISYSVSINGCMGTTFKPSRGLRKRDPLSPFFFLICSEGLYSLMQLAL